MMKMTRNIVQVRVVSLMKRCQNHISQTAPAGISQTAPAGCGNPCVDLFYKVIPEVPATHYNLKQLLPPAWSHSPLTTLSIIRNFQEEVAGDHPFYEAIYWLHHSHPKTLACNLIPLLTTRLLGHYKALISIIYRILDLKSQVPGDRDWYRLQYDGEMEKLMRTKEGTDGVLGMYVRDPDFRFLHDEIAHLFAESLKIDIQNLRNAHEEEVVLEVTAAAEHCDGCPLLFDSVARRVFPDVAVEVAREQLWNEVLEPLKKALNSEITDLDQVLNIWGYGSVLPPEAFRTTTRVPCTYLKELEKSPDKMVPDALLPNELVTCVFDDCDHSMQVVELQWKAMVDSLKKKQLGILSHSLAVFWFNDYQKFFDVATALTVLISELSEEDAWKGKVIPLTPKPQLLSIQGHDLKSKCKFLCDPANMGCLSEKESWSMHIDCKEVFDLILQQAVNQSLKPEQMIQRVFVFSVSDEYGWVSQGSGGCWEARDYEEMQTKYKGLGYNMPPILFWRPNPDLGTRFADSPDQRGVATISGFRRAQLKSDAAGAKFVKMFLENDGQMSPQNIMEAHLSDEDYNYKHCFAVLD